ASGWRAAHPFKGYYQAMKRLPSLAACGLAIALLAPVSPAQVRGTYSNVGTGRAMGVMPSAQGGHGGTTFPTPIGVPPVLNPPRGFPFPTSIGVPPVLPSRGSNFGHHYHGRNNFGFGGAFWGGAISVAVPVAVPVYVMPYPMYATGN